MKIATGRRAAGRGPATASDGAEKKPFPGEAADSVAGAAGGTAHLDANAPTHVRQPSA